ncbi:MAG: ABC-type transport auxiliary lipoprotein family protein [Azoarcus sp.]|jgi:cholesterol transport system auxiliary component|nr:ABC-type transport auxiliary lipoprotein family protein [Azoarcus sp.]
MILKRVRRGASRALCAASLAACSVLPAPAPVDVYLLPATAIVPPADGGAARAWSLRLVRPEAGGQLIGQRILVMPEPNRVSVYQGASWHESAPLLMRNRLFEAFRADGRVSALSTDEMRTFADFELGSELGAFHSEYRLRGKAPEAVIRLDTRLIDTGSRRIVASHAFEAREAAAESSVPAVVAAFGIAADRLAAELLAWTIASADAARRAEAEAEAESLPVPP